MEYKCIFMSVPFQIVLYHTRIPHIAHHFNMPLDKTAFELKASFYIKRDINSILQPDFIDGQTADIQFEVKMYRPFRWIVFPTAGLYF